MPSDNYWARRVRRRQIVTGSALGVVGVVGLTFVGCGGNGSKTPSSTSAARASPSSTSAARASPQAPVQSQKGGYLKTIVPLGYNSTNIDPYTVQGGSIYPVQGKMWYEALIDPDFTNLDWQNNYTLKAKLGEKWEQPDPQTYLFTLRQGVKFHDGSTMAAEDVVYSYLRWNEKGAQPNAASLAQGMKSIEALDSKTVKFVAKTPDVEFIENFSGFYGMLGSAIMPKAAADAGTDWTKTAIGTGPFKLQSYQADSRAVAVRFDQYWDTGQPYLDGVTLTLGTDAATATAAFISRATDVTIGQDRRATDPLRRAVPDALNTNWYSDLVYGLALNAGRKPFDDVRVRQAINLALDRQQIESLTTFGDGLISGPLLTERAGYTMTHAQLLQLPGYRQPKDADITAAKQLLNAAGLQAGFKPEIFYNPTTATSIQPFAESFQAQLKMALSIDSTLAPAPDSATAAKRRNAGDFDMVVELAGGSLRPEARVVSGPSPIYSTSLQAMAAGWKDADIDGMVDAQKVEFDDKARGQIFQKMELKLLDLCWYCGIAAPKNFGLAQPWVHDWRDNRRAITSVVNPSWMWIDLSKAPANRKQA